MSQPLNSIFLGDPPAKNTRSRQETEPTMAQPPVDVGVVNTIVDQLRSMTLNDRLATFESSAHEVNTWLSRFESMARGKGWTAAVLHTRLPMYLGDDEHEWYEGLDPVTKESYPLLRAAFISEYTPKAASRFERETAMRSCKQTPDTSVKDFLTKIRREARAIALPEDKGVEIALNNMLPAARASITGRPTTYAEILGTPVARGEIPLPAPASSDNAALLQQLLAAVTKLQSTPGAAVARLDHEPAAFDRRPTPTPTDVREHSTPWSSRHPQGGCPGRQPQQHDHRPRTGRPPPGRQSGAPRPTYHQHSDPRPTYHQHRDPRPTYHQRRDPRPSYHQHRDPRQGRCQGCGGKCPSRSVCPAQGSRCYSCGDLDHLDKCCKKDPNAPIKFE